MGLDACEQSWIDRRRRDYYHYLREEITYILIDYFLTDSLKQYIEAGEKYPFVEMAELRPASAAPPYLDGEMPNHNTGLVLFLYDKLPFKAKRFIKYHRVNRVVAENITVDKALNKLFHEKEEEEKFDLAGTYLENVEREHFRRQIKKFLKTEAGLLIQPNPRVKIMQRYALTHYKVFIDIPIANTTESLALKLGYIGEKINEKDVPENQQDFDPNKDQFSDLLETKFCEYYGLRWAQGGRKTAGAKAAQYFNDLENLVPTFSVFIGSCEIRSLIRITRNSLWRYCLLRLSPKQVENIEASEIEAKINKSFIGLREQFAVYTFENGDIVVLFGVRYQTTEHSEPDEICKPGERELFPKRHWRTVKKRNDREEEQLLIPTRDAIDVNPIHHHIVYKKD
tara:strand:+ start:2871 stop:4061 length:1191 start_codon:yes stop_codon:yes gene_type:complete